MLVGYPVVPVVMLLGEGPAESSTKRLLLSSSEDHRGAPIAPPLQATDDPSPRMESLIQFVSPSPHVEGISAGKSEFADDGRRRLARCVRSIWYDPFRPRSSTPLLPCRFDGVYIFL
jgi:hypothetical protein